MVISTAPSPPMSYVHYFSSDPLLCLCQGIYSLLTSATQYRAQDQPWYTFGHGLVLLYIGLGIIASTTYYILLRRENAMRDRGERDEVIDGVYLERADGEKESEAEREERARRNGRFESVDAARVEKGDEWSGYRYML